MSQPVIPESTPEGPKSANRRSVWALVAMLVGVLVVPATLGRSHTPEPFDQSALDQFIESNATMVFIGNSLLDTRIDPDYMSELTGENVVSLAIEGTAAGVWLLQLENIVSAAENPPTQMFIFFHDDLITRQIHFTGPEDRTLVERLTDSSTSRYGTVTARDKSIAEKIRNTFVSIYPIAESPANRLSSPVTSIGAALAGVSDQELDGSSEEFFAFANKREKIATIQQPKFHGSFESTVNESFLPHIIDLADIIDVDLTIVRVATRPKSDGSANEPELLAQYSKDLAVYLQARGVEYIDMTDHVENGMLDAATYYDGYHLQHRFRETYTEFFAEWLLFSPHGDSETGTSQ